MSIITGDGSGNLLISYKFKSKEMSIQVNEEIDLKNMIASLLKDKGYKFIIADDQLIDKNVDKHIAKSPNYPYEDKVAYCPNCTMIVDDLYCGTCGQKIDWHNDNLRKGKI